MPDEGGYRRSLQRLVQLRWVASGVVLAALILGKLRAPSFEIELALIVGLLIPASNLIHRWLARGDKSARLLLLGQFGSDLLLLTFLLAATGGVDGPTAAPFVLHVLLAALLLSAREAIVIACLAIALAASLAVAQLVAPWSSPGLFSTVMRIDPPLNRDGMATVGRVAMLAAVSAVNLFLVIPVVAESRRQSVAVKEAEAAAMARLELLERLLDHIGASMMVMDDQHRLVWSNKPANAWFGELSKGERRPCYGSRTGHAGVSNQEVGDCATCQVIESFEPRRIDYVSADAGDGFSGVINVFATPLEEGGKRRVVEFVRDVTEERQREVRLVEARKAAATAVLASGIAHELSTPLASLALGLRTAAQACQRSGQERDVDVTELLRTLVTQVARCRDITESMLGYSRQLEARICSARARGIVNEAISELGVRRDLSGIEIEVVGPSGLKALCDPPHLQLALLNILANAVDSLRELQPDRPEIRVEIAEPAVDRAEIRIEDNGAGMSEEVRARVFDPFFSTKPSGRGSGLGLSLTETLLATMQGTITVESARGRGTRIVVGLRAAASTNSAATHGSLSQTEPAKESR